MSQPIRLRRGATIAITAAATLAAVGVVSVATGAIPDGSGKIDACYSSDGSLRVIDKEAGKSCNKGWTPLSWNQQGVNGDPGLQGPEGPQGDPGPQGPTGPSDAFMASKDENTILGSDPREILALTLPAGSYAINAKMVVGNLSNIDVRCDLKLDGVDVDHATVYLAVGLGATTIPLEATGTLSSQATAGVTCSGLGTQIYDDRIIAIKVGTVHSTS